MNVLRSLQIGFEDRSVTFLERCVVELIAIVQDCRPSATFPHVSRMAIDNLHVRLIFDLGKKKVNSRKELIKISKIAKFGYEML